MFTERDYDLVALGNGAITFEDFMMKYGMVRRSQVWDAAKKLRKKERRNDVQILENWPPPQEVSQSVPIRPKSVPQAELFGYDPSCQPAVLPKTMPPGFTRRARNDFECPVPAAIPAITAKTGGKKRVTAQEIWDAARERSNQYILEKKYERDISVSIETSGPIGIVFLSDQHLDAPGCDIERAENDARMIAATPGMFAILPGDINDLARLKTWGAMTNQMLPQDGIALTRHYLGLFGGKILAAHTGNHDEWLRKISGVDSLGSIAGVLWSHHSGTISLYVGDKPEKYVIFSTHRTTRNSQQNYTHTCFRALESLDSVPHDTDVVVVGHSHTGSQETRPWKGRNRVGIRPGSYKVEDDLFVEMGMNSNRPSYGAIFWPNSHRVMGCDIDCMKDVLDIYYSK